MGVLAACAIFLTTLSFLVSTPGVWVWAEGVPVPVPSEAAGFLVKDVFLLGGAALTAGEALGAAAAREAGQRL